MKMKDSEKKPTPYLKNGEKIRKLIAENPDLPFVFLASDTANIGDYSTMFCSDVIAEIGEFLDCQQEINDEMCFTDRDDFEDVIYDNIINSDEYYDHSQEWCEKEAERIAEEYAPYWKKCIIVTVGN